jgi:hypothetical protein
VFEWLPAPAIWMTVPPNTSVKSTAVIETAWDVANGVDFFMEDGQEST